MAEAKSGTSEPKDVQKAREEGTEVPIASATDGGDSRLTKGYPENPDAPEGSVAQVEELVSDAENA